MMRPRKDPDPITVPFKLRRELLDEGWNDKIIYKLLAARTWTRLRHGAYIDTSTWTQLDDAGQHIVRTRAAVLQAKTDVVVSHVSAAMLYGVPTWGLPLGDVHLTRVDGKVGRREAGICQHRGALAKDDVEQHHGLKVMSPTRAALELMGLATVEAAMAAVSDLMHAELTSQDKLEERYHRDKASLLRWPGSRTTDLVLRLADSRFESIAEARTFYLCWSQSLPAPIPQYEVFDEHGLSVARLDFAWPELGVFLEFDGKVKYEKLLRPGERASDVVVREKQRESLVCQITGWRCIRITWADLETPEATARLIRRVLYPLAAA